ncbi:NAP1-related protein 2 [Carex littledalei]|uniref:NAP1-related protein 2 n=1 Tax=Carex littledalei TaxID=544730 RepID=A0A833QTE8_9POAL|nr:NAP1-related protein 2 [Carex littledalei]
MSGTGNEKKEKVEQGGGSGTCHLTLRRSIANIRAIQDELHQINARAEEEALKLEHKYNVRRKPVYVRRNKVITSIRGFWLATFCNHPILGTLLTEEDQKILKNMVSLDVEEADNVKSGFSISFSFSPNLYFEDEKLTKRYWFDDDGYLSVVCKPINWKEGKGTFDGCFSPDKGGKPSHTFKRCSFFCWFSEAVRFDGEVDEIANILRGDMWPNPLQYFPKKDDAVELHMQQESEEDSKTEEVTGGGNEADDEEEDENNETEEEESEDRHVANDKDSGADDNKVDIEEYHAEHEVVDDEFDEGYSAEDDENDDFTVIC